MNNTKTEYVLDTVIRKCRLAFQAKTPLILLDTMENELAEDVALSGKLVTLLQDADKKLSQKEKAYYAFLDEQHDRLKRCVNLHFGAKKLLDVAVAAGDLNAGALPGMFVIQINRTSWQESKDESSTIAYLRSYVKKYLRSHDNSSPLRSSCVLLYGDVSILPGDLLPYTEIIEIDYPSRPEIMELVTGMIRDSGKEMPKQEELQEIAADLSGFGLYEIKRLIQRLLWTDDIDGNAVISVPETRKEVILEAKKQVLLQNGGLLELQNKFKKKSKLPDGQNESKKRSDQLGGMLEYRKWVEKYKNHMNHPEDYLLQRGIPAPKGVLLCGVPGCGKSEAAKILQQEWQLPLVRLNIDQLMGGHVGDSERNMRMALRQAEAMAPCIVWIDELDKGFSGASSGNSGDSGTFKRVFGRLLTWMQENTRACFIFATANDISQLPPEFFRSGRFDALFSVYMPTWEECMEIFAEQMRRAEARRNDEAENRGIVLQNPNLFEPSLFDTNPDHVTCLYQMMNIFTETKKFLTGADIAKIVLNALLQLSEASLRKPITETEWRHAVESVVKSPTMSTYGSSSANLDKIAACYLRLIRGNFVPACDSEQVLLKSENYHVEWDEEKKTLTASYDTSDQYDIFDSYDEALYQEIVKRFTRIADRLENYELNQSVTH